MNRRLSTVNRKLALITIITGFALMICCVFASIRVFSYIAVAAFVIYFIYLGRKDPSIYAKYLAYVFMMFAAVAGTIVSEFSNIYLFELEAYAHFVGSLPLLLFSYWILFVVFLSFEKRGNVQIRETDTRYVDRRYIRFIDVLTGITTVIYLIMFLSVIRHAAFILGIDRFIYSSQYESNKIIAILTNLSGNFLLFPLLSILYGKKWLGWTSLGFYFLYFLWTGNKFGPFFTVLCIFCLIYYVRLKNKGLSFSKKVLRRIAIVFAVLIVSTVAISIMMGETGGNYLLKRTAAQGQEWWKTYEICKGTMHPQEFGSEIDAILNGNKGAAVNIASKNGIYRIMHLTAPASRVNFKLSTGSVYTEAGFASAYYYFGVFGNILFSIVMGIIIAGTLNGFIRALNSQDIIKMLILLRLFQLERTAMSMFLFYDLFDPISILSYVLLLVSYGKNFAIVFDKGKVGVKLIKRGTVNCSGGY